MKIQEITDSIEKTQSPRLIGWGMDYESEPNTPEHWLASFFSYVLEAHSDAQWEMKKREWQLPQLAKAAHADILRAGGGETYAPDAVKEFIETYLQAERLKRFQELSYFWYSLHFQDVSESEITPERRAGFVEIFEQFVLKDAPDAPSWRCRRLWQESGFTIDQLLECLVYDLDNIGE